MRRQRSGAQLREVRVGLRRLSVDELEDSLNALLDSLREHRTPGSQPRSAITPTQRAALVRRIRQLVRLTEQRLSALEDAERRDWEADAAENPSQRRAARSRAAADALRDRCNRRRAAVLAVTHEPPEHGGGTAVNARRRRAVVDAVLRRARRR